MKKQFREPELLNILLMRWTNAFRQLTKSSLLGWVIHYLVGVFFMFVFYLIWEFMEIEATLLSGGIMGFAAGILGVIGWQFTFWIHPNPPKLDFKHYYVHLILAHVVFGISGEITYNYLNLWKISFLMTGIV
ncbi:hypothetical protein [Lunatibacter salilacus]|uniref:hypothetical protein n=1 Tax=Lunatibacter salilacus TaxID=2483804 RepID=UPI00131D2038|nr:hypothetical protein [Lunatibacter salilacus]